MFFKNVRIRVSIKKAENEIKNDGILKEDLAKEGNRNNVKASTKKKQKKKTLENDNNLKKRAEKRNDIKNKVKENERQ